MNILLKILKWLGLYKHQINNTSTTTTTIKTNSKIKVALCLGLNDYPGTGSDLAGCVNDAKDFANYFKAQNFNRIEVLLNSQYTYSNFNNKIRELSNLNPDVFAITNSSHGTSLVDTNADEIDGRDEAICMYDKNVRDDEIRLILDRIPLKTTTIIFCDSCHSGTITRSFLAAMNNFDYVSAPRYLPPNNNLDATALLLLPLKRSVFVPRQGRKEILFSGCADSEYSFDAAFNNKPNGAFSYYCLNTLINNPDMTYLSLYQKIRNNLPNSRYPQTPRFECSLEELKNQKVFE